MTRKTAVADLKKGDRVRLGPEDLTVEAVENFGGAFVIIDFTDGTATPPVAINTAAEVIV